MRANRNDMFNRIHREETEKVQIRVKTHEDERLLVEKIRASKPEDIKTYSVSEALRLEPLVTEHNTDIVKVRGHDFVLQRVTCHDCRMDRSMPLVSQHIS